MSKRIAVFQVRVKMPHNLSLRVMESYIRMAVKDYDHGFLGPSGYPIGDMLRNEFSVSRISPSLDASRR